MINQSVGSLTLATPVTEVDPAIGNASVAVQVQNNSGFELKVLAAGLVWAIQPFYASTVPTGGSPVVTITPTLNVTQASSNALTLVWLLRGETSPIPNGSLTTTPSTVAFQATTVTLTSPTASGVLLPPAPSGMFYVLSTFVVTSNDVSAVTVKGTSSGTTFLNNQAAGTYNPLVTGPITEGLTMTPNYHAGNATIPVEVIYKVTTS